MTWLSENWGTLLVLAVVVLIVAAILAKTLKDKKAGVTSCGNNCAHCASHGVCHGKGGPLFRTTMEIDGMMCGMCEAHVNDALRAAFPSVKKVSSSYKKGTAEVLSAHILHEDEVRAALEPTGYRLVSLRAEPAGRRVGPGAT